jgi:hypothetical protein
MPEGFVSPQHAILPEFPTGEQKPLGGFLSNQSSDGFQTQLSETFNKQRREDQPLLEAFLDANGRLAFRFVDAGGNAIAQPRVTTPGFVPSSLGITPPLLPGTTPPNGLATASENLVIDSGGAAGGGGDPENEGQTGGFGARAPGPPSQTTTNIGRVAIGVPAVGTAMTIARNLQRHFTSVVPVGNLTQKEAQQLADSIDASLESGTLSASRAQAARQANKRSRASLDSMSNSGTSGPSSGVGSQAGQSGGQGPSGGGGRGGGGPASGGGDPGPDAGPGGPGTGF